MLHGSGNMVLGPGTGMLVIFRFLNQKVTEKPGPFYVFPDEGANFNWDMWRAKEYMNRIRLGPDGDSEVEPLSDSWYGTQLAMAGRNAGTLQDEDRCYASAIMYACDTDLWADAKNTIYSDGYAAQQAALDGT